MNRILAYISMVILMGGFSACTGSKYLSEGQKYYNGADISLKGQTGEVNKQSKNSLEDLLLPKPNTRLIGSRPQVWIYYIAGKPKKDKGFKHWLKYRLGSEPVFAKDVDYEKTVELLHQKMNNEGFFQNQVGYKLNARNKSVSVDYTIVLGQPYHIRNITYPDGKDEISKSISSLKPYSHLKEGIRFSLNNLANERSRLEDGLKDRGYYFIDDDYLVFDVDTTVGNRQVDIFLRKKSSAPEKAQQRYKLNSVNVVHQEAFDKKDTLIADTVKVDSVNYIDPTKAYKPKAIVDKVNLRPGQFYSKAQHDFTIGKLVGLNTFKYVNINYSESEKPGYLDASIYLIPRAKKSIRVELQGILNSNDYLGPLLQLTFQNRNFFKGSELFQISLNAGFEAQLYGGQQSGAQTSFQLGLNSSLSFPKFITPFPIDFKNKRYLPQTKIKVGALRMKRVGYFTMSSVDLGFGYEWNETILKKHKYYPVDIRVVNLTSTTEEFRQLLESNSFLRSSYEEQFILGSNYSYYFNTQNDKDRESASDFYFNGNIDLSGNLAHLLQSTIRNNSEKPYKIGGSVYSQYVKTDFDFRYYYQIDKKNKLAFRLLSGIGYAYGNSNTLPYIEQFSIGGSNSIRAFRARSVGPGSYKDTTQTGGFMIDQTADIKFELNSEYRFDVIGAFKGAFFMDIGNIWTLKEDPNRPGSKFEWNNFLDDLAVGTGIGLRYDADFFVIRLDVAFPLRVPSYNASKWVFDKNAIPDPPYHKVDNVVYNIAIGYPF